MTFKTIDQRANAVPIWSIKLIISHHSLLRTRTSVSKSQDPRNLKAQSKINCLYVASTAADQCLHYRYW
jgi:hypothetical protein